MRMNPDDVFRKIAITRPVNEWRAEEPRGHTETVYIPSKTRDGSYRQLMRSHDRMGTRHLQ